MRIVNSIVGFLVLLFVQEYLLTSINLWGVVNFFPYVMVLLLLPLSMGRGWLLLVGCAMGWCVDLLGGMAGLTAICMTWIGFMRPYVAEFTLGRDVSVADVVPLSRRVGAPRFLTYVGVLCLLFALPYFLLEMMTLSGIGLTLLRVVLSTVATTVVVYLFQLPLNK